MVVPISLLGSRDHRMGHVIFSRKLAIGWKTLEGVYHIGPHNKCLQNSIIV